MQIAVACGDFDAATEASTELATIAADFESPALLAASGVRSWTSHARAPAIPAQACAILRQALERWQDLDVPYEVATARLLLARRAASPATRTAPSHRSPPRRRSSSTSAPALDTRFIDDLRDPSALPGGLTEREAEVLRLVASGQSNKDIAATLLVERAHRRPPPVEHLHEDRRRLTLRGHRLRLRARPALTRRPPPTPFAHATTSHVVP